MNLNHIDDSELLYRAVVGSQRDLIRSGAPQAALFMNDKEGLSVDRDGGRPEAEILQSYSRRFHRAGCSSAVKISAGDCRAAETYPVPAPSKRNSYHAEIHDSDEVVPIRLIKALKLARLCQYVEAS